MDEGFQHPGTFYPTVFEGATLRSDLADLLVSSPGHLCFDTFNPISTHLSMLANTY
jgi:hypothetical protein